MRRLGQKGPNCATANLKGNPEALVLEWFARQAEAHPELLNKPSLVSVMWGNFKDSVADLMARMGLEPPQGKDLDTQVMALLQRARQSAVKGGSGPNAGSGVLGQDLQFSMGGTGGNAAPGSISPAPGPPAPASLAGAGTTIQSLHSKAADGTLTPSEAQQYEQAQKTIAQDRVANLEARKANGTITLAEERALDGFKKILDGSLAPPPGYNPLAANQAHQDWYPPQGSKPVQPPPEAFTPEALAISDEDVRSTVDRMKGQGHAWDRHGPEVLDGQLDDRVKYSVDPITQTKENGDPPGRNHRCAEHATQFTSERALAQALRAIEQNPSFTSERNAALNHRPRPSPTFVIKMPLKEVLGDHYMQHVRGKSLVDINNPSGGTTSTNFADGEVKAVYKFDSSTGTYYLLTMYPDPQ